MLIYSGLPKELWGEAVMCYNYTRNFLPNHEGKIRNEIWYGTQQDVSHLRTFGEVCYPHLMPQHQKSKLDPRAYSAILLGYDSHSKAYRVYNPKTGQISLSRSVTFNNDKETDRSRSIDMLKIPNLFNDDTPKR